MAEKQYAHWERGYRMHGYWCNGHRIGFVGLPHNARGLMVHGYSYGVGVRTIGHRKTLRAAKANVERRLLQEGYYLAPISLPPEPGGGKRGGK